MAKRSVRSSPRLFISYRRDDTGGDAGRLNDTLNQLLGSNRTFFDFDQIAPGMDFEVQLERALSASEVLLALIGPKWETVSDSSGKPRLSDKKDLVRIELLAALKSKEVRIVPILLNRELFRKRATCRMSCAQSRGSTRFRSVVTDGVRTSPHYSRDSASLNSRLVKPTLTATRIDNPASCRPRSSGKGKMTRIPLRVVGLCMSTMTVMLPSRWNRSK